MPNSLSVQAKEISAAAVNPFSYNVLQNSYIWCGFIVGLTVPLLSPLLPGADSAHNQHGSSLLAGLIYPLIFGVFSGILGSVRRMKQRRIEDLTTELERTSTSDSLTGLFNPGYLGQVFHSEAARAQRMTEPFSLISICFDNFSQIKETPGTLADEIVNKTGIYLKALCRPYDTPARWQDEMFMILLPNTTELEAMEVAERIHKGFPSALPSEIGQEFTLSMGISQYEAGDTLEKFTGKAEKALSRAQHDGPGRTVRWSSLQLDNHQEQ